MNNRHIFLVGYRGSGKTTVGRLLAQRMGRTFIDMDDMIEAAAHCTVKEIFQREGEPGFRLRESNVLHSFENPSLEPTIIATGGGVILSPVNRAFLKSHGFVVWLKSDPQTCYERMQTDATTVERRPNLTVGGLQEVEDLIRLRSPMYAEVANLAIDTWKLSPEEIVDSILS